MEAWEIELRNTLGNVKKKENVINLQKFTFFLTFVVSLVFCTLFLVKFPIPSLKQYFTCPPVIQPQTKPFPEELVKPIQVELNKLSGQIQEINNTINILQNKVLLLGTVHNENFSILMKNEAIKNATFFNKDWTLNKMPENIEYTPSQEEYLKKHISSSK